MSEQTNLNLGQANPTGEPAPTTVPEPGRNAFRERKRQELGAVNSQPPAENREETPNLQQAELPERTPEPAHQPDLRDQEPEPLGIPEEPTALDAEPGVELTPAPDVDEPPQTDGVDWQAKYSEAEELRGNMQSDYQRKTQKLAEDRRELKSGLETNKLVAESYLNMANQNLQKFSGVDWQRLQSTLDPVEYNRRVQSYQQAVTQRDRMVSFHTNIVDEQKKRNEESKEQEAEVSRDILAATIPKWSNELYSDLRSHAINKLGFSPDEFNDLTDHRVVQMIHHHWSTSVAGKTVQQLTKQSGQQPPQGRNLPASRGADGKFRNARQSWLDNPGEKGQARNFFQEKLRNEREGK